MLKRHNEVIKSPLDIFFPSPSYFFSIQILSETYRGKLFKNPNLCPDPERECGGRGQRGEELFLCVEIYAA